MAGYLGAIPVPQATQNRESFTALANQTSFATAGYTAGFVDVFLNGVRLNTADFTATNGSDVVLGSGAAVNDILDVISYATFEINAQTFTGTTTMTDVVATSLDISGNIDIDGITNLDVVNIAGAVSVGVDGTGYDVKFFGDTASAFMLWDQSADDLILGGAAGLSVNSTALVTGVLTTTAQAVFNGGFDGNAKATINTSDGLSSDYALVITNGEATAGQNFGLRVRGGSNASDVAFTVETYDNGDDLFRMFGNGQASFHDGTAALPSITNIGDLNTGIFFPAADTIGFATASKTLLTLTETVADFNPSAINIDFNVRSDGNDSMLFVDGADNQVRIGRSGDVDGFNLVVGTTTAAGAIAVIGRADDISQVIFYEADASTTIAKIDARNSLFNVGSVANVPVGIIVNNSQMATFGANHLTIGDGNLIIGTAGHGIDFSAQTATSASGSSATSELLDHYEEGTFTPTIFGGSTAGTYETASVTGNYTRIGNVVTAIFEIVLASSITAGGSGNMHLAGIPFPYDASLNKGFTGNIRLGGVDFNSNAKDLNLVRQSGSDSTVFVISELFHNATQGVVQAGEFAANDSVRSSITYLTLT